MVLVDEGQDLSPITLDALEHCRKRIIVVGDTHQQIYSSRYAIDAMKRFPFDDERDLTMNFRTPSFLTGGKYRGNKGGYWMCTGCQDRKDHHMLGRLCP